MLDNDNDVELIELQVQPVVITVWITEWKRAQAGVESVAGGMMMVGGRGGEALPGGRGAEVTGGRGVEEMGGRECVMEPGLLPVNNNI